MKTIDSLSKMAGGQVLIMLIILGDLLLDRAAGTQNQMAASLFNSRIFLDRMVSLYINYKVKKPHQRQAF